LMVMPCLPPLSPLISPSIVVGPSSDTWDSLRTPDTPEPLSLERLQQHFTIFSFFFNFVRCSVNRENMNTTRLSLFVWQTGAESLGRWTMQRY
jgi:hypothetical protein